MPQIKKEEEKITLHTNINCDGDYLFAVYDYVQQRLALDGISKNEYKLLKNIPAEGHSSMGHILKTGLRLGYLKWKGNKIVSNKDRDRTPKRYP